MKKVFNFILSIALIISISACGGSDSPSTGSSKETSGTVTATINGENKAYTTTKTSTSTTEENTASIEREDNRIDVSISGVKKAGEDELSFGFKLPTTVTTGTYELISVGAMYNTKLSMAREKFEIEITKIEDHGTYIHMEGRFSNVVTEDSKHNTYEIDAEFSVDASQRSLNGEPVHSHF